MILKNYNKSGLLEMRDVARPMVKEDEIVVRVYAAGLNPIDSMIPKGTFKPILGFSLPAVMGSDLAGVVEQVGEKVTRFQPGDAVFASLFDTGKGALCEYVA